VGQKFGAVLGTLDG